MLRKFKLRCTKPFKFYCKYKDLSFLTGPNFTKIYLIIFADFRGITNILNISESCVNMVYILKIK